MGARNLIIRALPTVSNTLQVCNVSKPAQKGWWCRRLHLLLIHSTYCQETGNATLPPFLTVALLCINKISEAHLWLCSEGDMTTHLSCLPSADMLFLQTANWDAADLIVWEDKIPGDYFLYVVFRGRCFFPLLLLHQYLIPMPLINIVPWLSWLCHNLHWIMEAGKAEHKSRIM